MSYSTETHQAANVELAKISEVLMGDFSGDECSSLDQETEQVNASHPRVGTGEGDDSGGEVHDQQPGCLEPGDAPAQDAARQRADAAEARRDGYVSKESLEAARGEVDALKEQLLAFQAEHQKSMSELEEELQISKRARRTISLAAQANIIKERKKRSKAQAALKEELAKRAKAEAECDQNKARWRVVANTVISQLQRENDSALATSAPAPSCDTLPVGVMSLEAKAFYVFKEKGKRGSPNTDDGQTFTEEEFAAHVASGVKNADYSNGSKWEPRFPHYVDSYKGQQYFFVKSKTAVAIRFRVQPKALGLAVLPSHGIKYSVAFFKEDGTRVLDRGVGGGPVCEGGKEQQIYTTNATSGVLCFTAKPCLLSKDFDNSAFYVEFTPVDSGFAANPALKFRTKPFVCRNKKA